MQRRATKRLLLGSVLLASASSLVVGPEGSAQRAPLLIVTERPISDALLSHPRARVSELRVEDDGRFTINGSSGQLSPSQLQQLRAERQRVRWVMAPVGSLCEAIAQQSFRVQSQGRSISWETPCSPMPHASVLLFVSRAQAIVRTATRTARTVDAGVVSDADAASR